MSTVDLSLIREDFRQGYSVRMLAAKYGVSKSAVNKWAKKYGWIKEVERYTPSKAYVDDAVDTLVDTMDKAPPLEPVELPDDPPPSVDYVQIRKYTQKLLKKADELLDLDDALAPRDLKSLSSMLLDVRQLLNVQGPYEDEERRLRLAILRKQLQEQEKEKTQDGIEVVFVGDTEEAAQ